MTTVRSLVGTLALVPLLASATAGGKSSCPCVEWAELDRYATTLDGRRCIAYSPGSGVLSSPPSSGQEAFCYPPDYGSTVCKRWDVALPPTCADSAGNALPNAPSWCTDSFCYIDPSNCDSSESPTASSLFEGVYYSYSTCGSGNSFVDWAADQQARRLTNRRNCVNHVLYLPEGY